MNFFAKAGARILENEVVYNGWSRFHKLLIAYTGSDGTTTNLSREVSDHGAAVAILLYDPERDIVVFVRQFRVATFFAGRPPFLIEVPAGLIDEDSPEDAVRREASEETGYVVEKIRRLYSIFPSAGALTEEVHMFVGIVKASNRLTKGAGLQDEHEDIEVMELKLDDAYAMIGTGEINDAKTIILLQWAILNRGELAAGLA